MSESQLDSCVVVLGDVLFDGFLLSFIFFGFDKGQLLLLEPISIDLSSDWDFFLDSGVDFNALALIVLGKSWFLGFLRLFLFLRDLFNWGGSSDLLCGFFVFISVEFVSDVTNVSSSSTLLSWSVVSAGAASSVEGMTFSNTLDWSALSVMSDLFGIVSDSGWDFSVNSFNGGFWCISSGLFKLSSFLVS
jgi:hypothetical protein